MLTSKSWLRSPLEFYITICTWFLLLFPIYYSPPDVPTPAELILALGSVCEAFGFLRLGKATTCCLWIEGIVPVVFAARAMTWPSGVTFTLALFFWNCYI